MSAPVVIADTIRMIPQNQWDVLNGNNPLSSYGWLLTVEETLIKEVSPRYFIFRCNEKILGAAVCYEFPKKSQILTLDNLLFGRLKPIVNAIGISFMPCMVCCPLKSSGQHILLAVDLDRSQKEKIIEQILDAMNAESTKRKIALSYSQVFKQEEILINLLTQRGFHQTIDRSVTYLDILWDTFEGYKNSIRMKSPKWKRNILQDINKNRRSGVKIETVGDDFLGQEERMVDLINRNYFMHNMTDLPFNKNILSRLKINLKQDAEIYRATKNGRTSGVSVMLKRNGIWSFVLVGIDNELAQKDATYFNILFYRPIQDAIVSQIKRIYYGNGLYDLKIRRGCDIMKTFIFYKSYHPMHKFLVKIWFLFHRFWYQRKFGSK
jgi:predicted N-acyltransferase